MSSSDIVETTAYVVLTPTFSTYRKNAEGELVEIYRYEKPRRPEWPAAEFVVGNPPFIGKGELMRAALGEPYLEALRAANPNVK